MHMTTRSSVERTSPCSFVRTYPRSLLHPFLLLLSPLSLTHTRVAHFPPQELEALEAFVRGDFCQRGVPSFLYVCVFHVPPTSLGTREGGRGGMLLPQIHLHFERRLKGTERGGKEEREMRDRRKGNMCEQKTSAPQTTRRGCTTLYCTFIQA